MPLSISDFWKLAIEGRLLSEEQCQKLEAAYRRSHQPSSAGAKPLAKWLIQHKRLTRYQAAVLLAGRPGPFRYGSYKLLDRLEHGRLAGMFRAVHLPTRHLVLLQFLTAQEIEEPQCWATTSRRVEQLVRLSEAHLQHWFEAVDAGPYKFVVCDDLKGQSLEERIQQSGPMAPTEASRTICLAARGLACLHEAGLVHGHVGPAHLWLDSRFRSEDGHVQLLIDPRVPDEPPSLGGFLDEDQAVRADYWAPELAFAGRRHEALTDIYALGCTFYYLLSGKPPFAGGTVREKMRRHATEAIRPLEEIGVPPALAQLVAYMMAKNSAIRYQDASTITQQLASIAPTDWRGGQPRRSETLETYQQYLRQNRRASAPSGAIISAPAGMLPPRQDIAAAGSEPSVAPRAASPVPTEPPLLVSAPPPASRLRRPKSNNRFWFVSLASMAAGAILLGGVIAWNYYTSDADRLSTKGTSAPGIPASDGQIDPDHPLAAAEQEEQNRQRIVPDDGQLPWASPTDGPPITLDYVPPGGQLFIVARPSEILAHPEGMRLLEALGADAQQLLDQWEALSGVSWKGVGRVIVTLHPVAQGEPRLSLVVHLNKPVGQQELLSKWGSPRLQTTEDWSYYVGSDWSYLIPPSQDSALFVMGAEAEIMEVAKFQGAPPPLRRELEHLRRNSDQQRMLTVLFAPNFFFTEGRTLFSEYRKPLMDWLQWFFGTNLQAGMFSLHMADLSYGELRLYGPLDKEPTMLAKEASERLSELPERVESYLAGMDVHPYWRKVAFRYPQMLRLIKRQTRAAVETDHALLNIVLPQHAPHNLVFGADMLLASSSEMPPIDRVSAPPTGPQSLQKVLQMPLSLAFDQQSLEAALEDLANQVTSAYPKLPEPFKIKIVGDDLRQEGITRNQQIRNFQMQDSTVADVLTQLLMKANPITTVRSPTELDQKLVWVVAPDPDDQAQQIVLVTTRQAANQKGYVLPEAFRADEG